MIKECNVITWNELVMVIEFDGVLVQMPSTKTKETVVYVKFNNKNYQVVTKDEYDKSLVKVVKKEYKKEVIEIDE